MNDKNRFYTIPVNYDEGKLKVLGYFSIRAIVEALVLSLISGIVVYGICSLFGQRILGAIMMVMIFITLLIVNAFGINGQTIGQVLISMFGFSRRKRKLKFRRVQKRFMPDSEVIIKEEESFASRLLSKDNDVKQTEGEQQNFGDELISDFKQAFLGFGKDKKKERYTQEVVPIKKIKNDIVQLKNGDYLKVLEFLPNNFLNKSNADQAMIIDTFSAFNKSSQIQVQWKIECFRTDPSLFLNNVDKEMVNEKEGKVKRLAAQLKDLVANRSANTTVDHRYFLIFRYKPKGGLLTKERAEDAILALNQFAANAIAVMHRCENPVVRHIDEEMFLYDFFYKFYNPYSSKGNEGLRKRAMRVMKDTKRVKGLKNTDKNPSIKPHNVIASKDIDFSYRNFLVMDGTYFTYLVIKDYPVEVLGGWLALFTSMDSNITFDVIVKREDRSQMLDKVGRKIAAKEGDINVMPEQSSAAQELKKAYYWDQVIQQRLTDGYDFFYVMIVVTIFDRDFKAMMNRRDRLKTYMKEKGFETHTPNFNIEAFFNSSAPVCDPDKDLFAKYRRNMLSDGASALYPLTVSSMNDYTGIPIGTEISTNTSLIYDPFNTKKRASANGYILGLTGSGKTYLTMLFALRLRILQTQVFIIAPIKGFEYQPMCDAVGGVRIPIGPSYPNCINIMQILPVKVQDAAALKNDVTFDANKSLVSEKIDEQLKPFFDILIPNMKKTVKDELGAVLLSIYQERGMIPEDNNSIYVNNDAKKGILKEMPTIQNVYEALLSHPKPEIQKLADYFTGLTKGTMARCFNGQTNVPVDNKFTVFDLDPIQSDNDTFAIGLYIVQNFVWRVVRQGRQSKKAIFYDEVWKMLKIPQAANTIREVYKTIRGFRGIAISATQELRDLTSSEAGQSIVACSTFQALFKANSDQARDLQDLLHLTEQQYYDLVRAERGEALICIDGEPFNVMVEATREEDRLFNTDGSRYQ